MVYPYTLLINHRIGFVYPGVHRYLECPVVKGLTGLFSSESADPQIGLEKVQVLLEWGSTHHIT